MHFEIEYRTVWGENIGVLTSNSDTPVMLSTTDGCTWKGDIDAPTDRAATYRYGVWRDGRLVRREIGIAPHRPHTDGLPDAWTDQHIVGTAVPLFSLRSEGSQGVGDFGDLHSMIDWCDRTGQHILQILPINDTTKTGTPSDSYPYSSISIFALHPMYADLRQLPQVKVKRGAEIREELAQYNLLPSLDYSLVNKLKLEYLRLLFSQSGRQTLRSRSYKNYLTGNVDWLLPYAVFCVLRDKYATADFGQWSELAVYDEAAVRDFCHDNAETDFYLWLQYQLHTQLKSAADHAREQGVLIKGDIPIGIDRHSVEAWQTPHLFRRDMSAGAPPDAFCADGQNWGFPTYDWDRMADDDYTWWRRRFTHMAQYFSAYRIDHILGFFRIWQIPVSESSGLMGQFSPALPLTADEIERWGLHFQEGFMTRPFINEDLLTHLFGHHTEQVKRTFLIHDHHDIWQLQPTFSTGKDIDAWFTAPHRNPLPDEVRRGLHSLRANVLFLPDHQGRGWHPRIGADGSHIFSRLNTQEQEAYRRIHNHYFYERHNQFWREQALCKLPPLLSSTMLLPCGEDLGMVPECVPAVMQQLSILSLEIERMPKNPWQVFGEVASYPVLSVCTTGTHDMSPLRLWWQEDTALTQRYYSEVLGGWGPAPAEATPQLCEQIISRHLASPSLLCILPLQDWLAIDGTLRHPDPAAERINVPADPHHYWRYRMHITLDALLANTAFNEKLSGLIAAHRPK